MKADTLQLYQKRMSTIDYSFESVRSAICDKIAGALTTKPYSSYDREVVYGDVWMEPGYLKEGMVGWYGWVTCDFADDICAFSANVPVSEFQKWGLPHDVVLESLKKAVNNTIDGLLIPHTRPQSDTV